MEYRQLGQTDIKVSVIAMGTWAIVDEGNWGPQDEQDAIDAIHASLDEGVNFFDTAEGYGGGASEQLLARGLGDRRSECVIATKVSPNNLKPEDLKAACERSLKNLSTDVIDLYQVHWNNPDVPAADVMGALESLKSEGKVRAIGVSNFGVKTLDEYTSLGRIESNQMCYSLLARGIEFEVKPKCESMGIGILAYSPIAQGLLTGKFKSADEVPEGRARTRHFSPEKHARARHGEAGCEAETFAALDAIRELGDRIDQPMAALALAWAKQQPGITSIIAGARNAEQAKANAQHVMLPLADMIHDQLSKLTEPVKEKLGPNPDIWQGGGDSRIA